MYALCIISLKIKQWKLAFNQYYEKYNYSEFWLVKFEMSKLKLFRHRTLNDDS